jgi:hypothetical protein
MSDSSQSNLLPLYSQQTPLPALLNDITKHVYLAPASNIQLDQAGFGGSADVLRYVSLDPFG